MDYSVCSGLEFKSGCCQSAAVYRSVWDRLVQQLFGMMPMGMNGEEQIPDVDIWKDSIIMTKDTEPYSFTIVSDDDDAPKPGDVVEYRGQFYIIGEVD